MPIIKKNIKPSTWVKLALIALGVLLLCAYIFWDLATSGPIFSRFSNREWVTAKLESLGPAAPLLFILLTIVQTVVAPLPGQVVGGIGGFLFHVVIGCNNCVVEAIGLSALSHQFTLELHPLGTSQRIIFQIVGTLDDGDVHLGNLSIAGILIR